MLYKLLFFGPVFRQYVIVIVANFSILLVGQEVGWVSPALVKLRDSNHTIFSRPITEEEGAWIASLAAGSGVFAILFIGCLMDRFGRKRCLLIAFLPRLVLALLCLCGTEVWMLFVVRLFLGIPQVIALSVAPTYASEIASRDQRGALGTLSQILSSLGMLMMLSTGPFVSYLILNIVCAIVVLLLFIPQLFLPESPYFLYAQGRSEECLKLLIFLRGTEEEAHYEIKEYEASLNVNISKMELLRDTVVLKTFGKSLFLAFGFQMVGFNAVTVYLQTILESTKTNISPEISSVVIGSIQLFACVCTIFLSGRFGRKPILTISLIGMATGLIGLGLFFKLSENNYSIPGFLNYLPLISLILVIYCFNAGLGSIMWVLIAELFDGPSRAIGVTSSVFLTTVSVFITTKFFTAVVDSIGAAATYWVLSGNCLFSKNAFFQKIYNEPIQPYVNLASLSAGLGYGWPSPALVKLTNGTSTGMSQPITEEDGSWLVSLPCLVSIFPHFIAAYVMDNIGRKYCIIVTCILKTFACLLQTFADEVWMLLVARSALGALDAVVFCCVPAYASEVANKEIRGALGAVLNIFVTLGMVLLLSAGPFISYFNINLLYTAVTLLGTAPLIFLPESPYFLHSKGRKDESYKVLTYLRGSKELANVEILEYSSISNEEQSTVWQLFKERIFLKALIITSVLSLIGQLVCHNCIMAYLQTILSFADTTVKPEVASLIIGIIGLVASFCTLVTDKFGRKPILIVTLVGSGLSLLALGSFFDLKNRGYATNGMCNYIPVISLVLFYFCQSAGFASIYMIVIAELFDDPARATGMAIALTISSITVFITSKYFAAMTTAIGPGVYWICGVWSFVTGFFVGVWVPETNGKSFKEIQKCLGAKKVAGADTMSAGVYFDQTVEPKRVWSVSSVQKTLDYHK